MPSNLWRRALPAVLVTTAAATGCAAILTIGVSGAVAAAPSASRLASQVADPNHRAADPGPQGAHRQRAWRTPGPSVNANPHSVLAHTDPGRPVRVVSTRTVNGRPVVAVTYATGRADAVATVTTAQHADGVLNVSVDTEVHVAASEPTGAPSARTPVAPVAKTSATSAATLATVAAVAASNDTLRYTQWALDRLGAEDLWDRQSGAGVTVAVLDTGVDATHPDLAGAVIGGTDFVDPGGDGRSDPNGHGTHVAGIVAAAGNNRSGVAGLAQGVKVMPVRVLSAAGEGWSSDIAKGVLYATDHGAAVVSMSLGGRPDPAVATAVAYAVAHNVVVVAAGGNARLEGDAVSYPAADPEVIGVAATDIADKVASFSNSGSYIDVAAPGVAVESTYLDHGYASMSGTSMSTPYVAATVALMKAADPSLSPAQAASDLESTADDLGPLGRDDDFGYGLISPAKAVCAVTRCTLAQPEQPVQPAPPGPPARATMSRVVVAPRAAAYGTTIGFTGQLTDAGTHAAVPASPVNVCSRLDPAHGYTCVMHRTDAHGNVLFRIKATRRVSVYVSHPATATTGASISFAVAVAVAPRLSLHATRSAVRATISPALRRHVILDQWTGHRWVTAKNVVTSAGTHTFTKLHRTSYRVRVPATATLAAATTHYVRVH